MFRIRRKTLVPAIFRIYLSPDDYEPFRDVVPFIAGEIRTALDERLPLWNRSPRKLASSATMVQSLPFTMPGLPRDLPRSAINCRAIHRTHKNYISNGIKHLEDFSGQRSSFSALRSVPFNRKNLIAPMVNRVTKPRSPRGSAMCECGNNGRQALPLSVRPLLRRETPNRRPSERYQAVGRPAFSDLRNIDNRSGCTTGGHVAGLFARSELAWSEGINDLDRINESRQMGLFFQTPAMGSDFANTEFAATFAVCKGKFATTEEPNKIGFSKASDVPNLTHGETKQGCPLRKVRA